MNDGANKIAEDAMFLVESMTSGDEWPDVLPINVELLPVHDFDPQALLPKILYDWITDTAERMPCPLDFIGSAAMVAIGSVIGARCVIKPKQYDDWSIVPNLWGGVVSPPSAKKTPAISAALDPLNRLFSLAKEEHAEEMKEYEIQNLIQNAKREALEKLLKKAAGKELQ
jgi:hypothetical protein